MLYHQTLTLTLNHNPNTNPNHKCLLVSHDFSEHDVLFDVGTSHDTSPPAIHPKLINKCIPPVPVVTKTVLVVTRVCFVIPSLKFI